MHFVKTITAANTRGTTLSCNRNGTSRTDLKLELNQLIIAVYHLKLHTIQQIKPTKTLLVHVATAIPLLN